MKDLFDKALIALPAFVSQVLELLSGPKAFILHKDLATTESALEAYTFLGVTLFIALIAQVVSLPEQEDYLLTFASIAVQGALGLDFFPNGEYFRIHKSSVPQGACVVTALEN